MAKNPTTTVKESGRASGKSYGYQQPTEVETVAGAGDVDAQKQRVVSAFDDFLDALADRVSDHADDGGSPSDTPSTGSATPPSNGGTTTPTPATTTPAPTSGSTGGSTAPSTGGGGGAYVPSDGPAGGAKASGGESPAHEAFEAVARVQREAYRFDRQRESAMAQRKEGQVKPAPSVAAPAGGSLPSKHQSDSNRAPLTQERAFSPSFGSEGRPQGAVTREKMAVPLSKRPENAPAPGTVNVGKPIDAYFGSFGSALERAIARGSIDTKQYEVIIGTDDRIRVTNNQVYPWRCICSLLITANSGATYVGTGWLVGPRILLTAGHCVFMSDEGGWVRSIEVIPGRNAAERPFGSAVATDFRSVSGWTQDNDSNYDYGAIILPEANRFGDQLGWFGYASRTDDYLRSLTLNLSGYPGDGGKTGIDGTQWFASRTVKDVMERQISYEIDTFGGQSGSPVWEMQSDGGRYGVAIHTYGTSVSNGGTRITSDVFDNIVAWAGEAA